MDDPKDAKEKIEINEEYKVKMKPLISLEKKKGEAKANFKNKIKGR